MSTYTYGVYLRPDPLTCRAVHDLTELAKHQFGIVSAAAFPPHATLLGAVPSEATTGDIIAAISPTLDRQPAIPMHNAGITRHNIAITFDVDHTDRGDKNEAVRELAIALDAAFEPLKSSDEGNRMKPFDADGFRAHLSLASHDLEERPDIREEVEEFLRAQPHCAPSSFTAEWVTLFQFHSSDWSGEWWHDLTWKHLRSWRLAV